jgi:hypothetical protein
MERKGGGGSQELGGALGSRAADDRRGWPAAVAVEEYGKRKKGK